MSREGLELKRPTTALAVLIAVLVLAIGFMSAADVDTDEDRSTILVVEEGTGQAYEIN